MVVAGEVGYSESSQSLGLHRLLTQLQYNGLGTIVLVSR